jgi:hypothetical protein
LVDEVRNSDLSAISGLLVISDDDSMVMREQSVQIVNVIVGDTTTGSTMQ